MTDASEPTTQLSWDTAPDQFRSAHDKLRNDHQAVISERGKLEREVAMLRAGVDSTHPAFSYFNAGYEGKLITDDIKAEWAKIVGVTQQPTEPPAGEQPPPADDGTDPAAAEAMRRLQEERGKLRADAVAPGEEPTPDPEAEMLAVYHRSRAEGRPNVEAQRAGLQVAFDAAAAGDPRIVSDSATEAVAKWRRKHGYE